MTPVEGIEPIDGWVLMWEEYDHGRDRYPTMRYEAHHLTLGHRILQVSNYRFSPTQARYAWLLEHGTRQKKVNLTYLGGTVGVPWDNDDIDEEIARASS